MAHKKKIIFDNYVSSHDSKHENNENCSIFGNLNKTMKTEELFLGSEGLYESNPVLMTQKFK